MINDILKLTKKPELYDSGTAIMWTDLHISKKLLDVHLNPEFYEDVLPKSDIWNGQNVTFSLTSK